MALTYATLSDFRRRKRIKDQQWDLADENERRWLLDELRAATRFIRRYCRRDFFPFYDARDFPIPYHYYDLSLRRRTAADIFLDADLLETVSVTNEAGTALTINTQYFLQALNIYPKFAISIRFPQYWTGNGMTVTTLAHVDQAAVVINGLWGYHDDYDNAWIDTLEDAESGGIDISETSLTIVDNTDADNDGLAPRIEIGNLLRVDDELMEVINIPTQTELTVKRGARGSTAAVHTAGVAIKRWRVVEDIAQACYQIAKTWREADESKGGRQGVSDFSTGTELSIPGDPLKIVKSYVREPQTNQR